MLILYLHGCWSSRPPPIEPNKLYGVKINCTRDVFNIKLDMDKSFKGIVFAKDFLDECRVKGTSEVFGRFPNFRCACAIKTYYLIAIESEIVMRNFRSWILSTEESFFLFLSDESK